ncbi:MAG TPA: ABC transporter ATP-binding protein [Planctomycetaceae bacterium]|nr:ABC transporter ATP-binding protein [Planctomycetaceae bacterium]
MIELDRVTKLYGTVIGVNDISLSLGPGAYGLLGPNGSGKSTLLNLMTGQLRPTLGSVRVRGGDPWNNDELYRQIGFCPSSEGLYANVSGFDWVRYLGELHGLGRHEAASRAEEALDLVGLANAMHREMGGYSRGMRQRTKLAQALVHDPEFLILDEPFNGLDPVGRHEMTELLRDWIREGKSLLLASHILHEVEVITHSFLLICGGRLLASGTAEEVHTWLADVPNEVTIRCNRPRELGLRLLAEDVVESVRFERGGGGLVVLTRSPLSIYERLPAWIDGSGIEVQEIQSSDESLHELFGTLMRIHRGELM